MTKKSSLLKILSVLGHVAVSQAACSREVLQATKDAFLASKGISNIKISPTAKIAQNNVLVKSLQDTVYAAATGRATPFELFVLDEASCNVALMTVINAPTPLITSVRAQVAQSGEVTEVEIMKAAGKGSKGAGGVPPTVQNATALWSAPLHTGTGASPSRDQMVKILDSYPSGIQAGSGKNVQTMPDCARIENGMKMPFKCNQAFEGLKFPVTNRGFFVDTKTGVSLAKFFFDDKRMPLWIHEYMKISNEKITEIQAVYMNYPKGQQASFKDVLGKQK